MLKNRFHNNSTSNDLVQTDLAHIPMKSATSSSELPKYISSGPPGRTLVLCFDGTGDQFDTDNSNIVALFTMLKKGDNDNQMVYYQAGIGTYIAPQVATPLASKVSKLLDEAVAWNLHAHLMDGYEFLMQNYKAGDRICIFGFSRGAYTARAIAGMLHKVGLLPACNHQQVPFAYKMYTNTSEEGWQQSSAFKKAFSIDVSIAFLGVWDTVNSVGLIPRRLPFTTSNTIVRTFRHAVSLDEHRAKFKANLWNLPEPASGIDGPKSTQKFHTYRPNSEDSLAMMERQFSGSDEGQTDIEEVWFSGCHCDIGGGSVEDNTPHALARIPLRWMVREVFKSNVGIIFETDGLRQIGIDPHSIFPVVQQRPPPLSALGERIQSPRDHVVPKKGSILTDTAQLLSEEEHELRDALSPVFDQLSLAWMWWTLEYIPFEQQYQNGDNTWKTTFQMNRGQGRIIPKQEKYIVKVHRSVKMRMEAEHEKGVKYIPMASFQTALDFGNVRWID